MTRHIPLQQRQRHPRQHHRRDQAPAIQQLDQPRQQQVGRNHEQVGTQGGTNARRRAFRRVLAGAAAVALAATGALAIAPGTAAADAHRDGQWYLDDFNIDKVHELSQGEGVTIGVIDSGIDPDHPDLEGSIEAGTDYGDSTGKGLNDPIGHGTAITSVMAGHGHGKNNQDGILGIAPKAKIISVGIMWDESARNGHETANAIQYLVDQDVNIIMTGQGGSQDAIGDKAIEPATNAGIPIVAPAGNTAEDDYTTWPASAKGVIPVSGTNQNHKFWNGSTTLAYAATQPQLGLSAPGVDIPIAMPDSKYDNASGTSFSAPIVAGTLALIKSAYPKLDYWGQLYRLISAVDDKGDKGFDDKYGWGIVNPYKALTEDIELQDGNTSKANDRLPLSDQGTPVDNHPPDNQTEEPAVTPNTDDEAATDTPTGPPAWLTITIIATGALLTAALITTVVLKTRRGKKKTSVHGQTPHGPTPPVGPPPTILGNPAAQHSPGSTPPQTPQAPIHQPGQPDSAGTPPPTTDTPWQPPHDPNTNPPQ